MLLDKAYIDGACLREYGCQDMVYPHIVTHEIYKVAGVVRKLLFPAVVVAFGAGFFAESEVAFEVAQYSGIAYGVLTLAQLLLILGSAANGGGPVHMREIGNLVVPYIKTPSQINAQ